MKGRKLITIGNHANMKEQFKYFVFNLIRITESLLNMATCCFVEFDLSSKLLFSDWMED